MVFPEEVGAMTSTFWRSNRPLLLMAGAAERYQAGGRRRCSRVAAALVLDVTGRLQLEGGVQLASRLVVHG